MSEIFQPIDCTATHFVIMFYNRPYNVLWKSVSSSNIGPTPGPIKGWIIYRK